MDFLYEQDRSTLILKLAMVERFKILKIKNLNQNLSQKFDKKI